MNVIITAAGLGSRLGALTADTPKCLLRIGDATILEHQVAAFNEAGLRDLVIVRGHGAGHIDVPGALFVDNPRYASTNVLHSLMCASDHMAGGFVAAYSDIIFETEVLAALCAEPADIAVVVDRAWREAYHGRDQHPLEEAEKVVLNDAGDVRRIGKDIERPQQTQGEYIGLMKCTARGAWIFREMYERARRQFSGRPFGTVATFELALVSHFLQHLVDHKVRLRAVSIRGGWREIDTPQDLENARRTWRMREPCS